MLRFPAAGILLLMSPVLLADTVYLCTAEKVVDMGKKGGKPVKGGDHFAGQWILDLKSRDQSLRRIGGAGNDSTIECERSGESPAIICDDGIAGDFVLSLHTLRFIRTNMAVSGGDRDLMTLGTCRLVGQAP